MAGQDSAEKGIDNQCSSTKNATSISHDTIQKPLRGWRLFGVLSSLSLGLVLATIETSITATALVTIGEYFKDSVTVTWVVLAYLLSYMGFAIIFTRLSDGIGREAAVIIAYVLFAAFSLGGGLARTLDELIALRVLQGIGGSGLYSMPTVIGPEITPVQYWGALSSMFGAALATGSVLGPILGGVITERASWRWIYLFNTPAAIVGITVMIFCWPRKEKIYKKANISWQSFGQVDWLGAFLLLTASTLLVFTLQQSGSTAVSWNSAVTISTLTISGICWIGFFTWIYWLSFHSNIHPLRAIFPFTIALTRPIGPAIVLILLTGFPFFVAVINLPQRFQVVNGNSPIMAGVHLLPLLCSTAFGSFLGGAASSKKNRTSPALILATSLILLGSGLLSTLGGGKEFYTPTYGYQIILGLGVGLTFSSTTVLAALACKSEDVAAAQGALSQARILGGSIGLSMATIVLNNKVRNGLAGVLDPARIKSLEQSLKNISTLTVADQGLVAQMYKDAFNEQMRICTYLSAVALLAALATYQKNPASVAAMRESQNLITEESSDEATGLTLVPGAEPVQAKSNDHEQRLHRESVQ